MDCGGPFQVGTGITIWMGDTGVNQPIIDPAQLEFMNSEQWETMTGVQLYTVASQE